MQPPRARHVNCLVTGQDPKGHTCYVPCLAQFGLQSLSLPSACLGGRFECNDFFLQLSLRHLGKRVPAERMRGRSARQAHVVASAEGAAEVQAAPYP